jgi:hypothetical protein
LLSELTFDEFQCNENECVAFRTYVFLCQPLESKDIEESRIELNKMMKNTRNQRASMKKRIMILAWMVWSVVLFDGR